MNEGIYLLSFMMSLNYIARCGCVSFSWPSTHILSLGGGGGGGGTMNLWKIQEGTIWPAKVLGGGGGGGHSPTHGV